MRTLNPIFFILLINCSVSAQNTNDLITLQSKAVKYYNQGDYSNAIIVYEDLLAEQELAFGNQDIHVLSTPFVEGFVEWCIGSRVVPVVQRIE